MKQFRSHSNIKVLKKTKHNLPWTKEGSQNTKQAIRMELWQVIAVFATLVISFYFD